MIILDLSMIVKKPLSVAKIASTVYIRRTCSGPRKSEVFKIVSCTTLDHLISVHIILHYNATVPVHIYVED